MIHKGLSLILLVCALFSGQLMASASGHLFYRVHNPDHRLRHDADSDELRGRSREAADDLRDDHVHITTRRPQSTLR